VPDPARRPAADARGPAETHPAAQDSADQLAALTDACRRAETAARQAAERAAASGSRVTADADRIRDTLLGRWDTDRDTARAAATVVLNGAGRFGLRRPALSRATEQLTDWANQWRTHLPDLPTDPGQLAQVAGRLDNRPALQAAFDTAARRTAEDAHPEHATLRAAAHAAQRAHDQARHAVAEADRRRDQQLGRCGALGRTPDPVAALADVDRQIATAQHELTGAQARIAQLTAEPALLGQPPDRLAAERHAWRAARDADAQRRATLPSRPTASTSGVARPQPERLKPSVDRWATIPGLGR